MSEFLVVLGAVLPVFCIAGAGLGMRKWNWLAREADLSLLRLTINLFAPCLILDSILLNDALKQWDNLLLPPVIGFVTVALGVGAGWLGQYLLKLPSQAARRTFAFSVGIYNFGYVPLPLALLLFGRETAGVLFVHNIGVELAFWSLGLLLLGHESFAGGGWRRLLNPPMTAILLAVLFNLSGVDGFFPAFLLTVIHMLGQCAIPVGLILIGATIADYLPDFRARTQSGTVVAACLLRLGLLPVLFLLIARALPYSIELKQVIVLQAAMPSAVFGIIMAKHYRGDPATALRVVIATSAVALITIPLWIRFGTAFLGL